MTRTYVIVGAGPVGRHTAEVLRERGDEVRLVTRSGRVQLDGVESVAADASDPEALTRLTEGAAALFNCANPTDYTTWEQVWPPLAESLLTTAERTGATLVTASCLYPYGPTDAPMVEGQPDAATDHKGRLRAGMWAEARSRHEAGRLRAVEVRGADYVGAGVGGNGHITRHLSTATKGKAAWVIGEARSAAHLDRRGGHGPDAGRGRGSSRDLGTGLARAQQRATEPAAGAHRRPRGRRACSGRRPVDPDARAAGSGAGQSPDAGDRRAFLHVDPRPYVLESQRTQEELGLAPSPWDEICRRTVEGNREPVSA